METTSSSDNDSYFEAEYLVKPEKEYSFPYEYDNRFNIFGDYIDENEFNHSFDFLNASNCDMIIDDKSVPFTKRLSTEGNHKVKVILKPNVSLTTVKNMFAYCSSLIKLDISHLKMENVTDMSDMLIFCTALESVDFSNCDTKSVEFMNGSFSQCSVLSSINLGGKFNTENVKEMKEMLYMCESLKEIDLSNCDTKNVESMNGMMGSCTQLKTVNVSGKFNTQNVKDLGNMFLECPFDSLDLSTWDTGKVEDMSSFLWNCSNLTSLKISEKFITSQVKNMDSIFEGCDKLPTEIKNKIDPKGNY